MAAILVVDDQDDFRQTITSYLSKRIPNPVLEACDGSQALQILQSDNISLLIIDQKMPKQSGLDVVKEMQNTSKHTKFILLTSWDSSEISNQVENLGGKYLPKDIPLEVLLNEVITLCA